MFRPLIEFACRHIILFGPAKFLAELVIGFGLGVYFLPILTAEDAFLAIKSQAVDIGPVKAFENFFLSAPEDVYAGALPALIIWCKAFSEFITAARLS